MKRFIIATVVHVAANLQLNSEPNDEVRLIYSLPPEENKLTGLRPQQTMIVALSW